MNNDKKPADAHREEIARQFRRMAIQRHWMTVGPILAEACEEAMDFCFSLRPQQGMDQSDLIMRNTKLIGVLRAALEQAKFDESWEPKTLEQEIA